MAARSEIVLSVHGCVGTSQIHLGGLDVELTERLARGLVQAGFPVDAASVKYPGRHPLNICNRGARGKGAQLEITYDLRQRRVARGDRPRGSPRDRGIRGRRLPGSMRAASGTRQSSRTYRPRSTRSSRDCRTQRPRRPWPQCGAVWRRTAAARAGTPCSAAPCVGARAGRSAPPPRHFGSRHTAPWRIENILPPSSARS